MSNVHEDVRRALEEERGIATSGGRQFNSIRVETGETVFFRFLPVELGPRKIPFARVARHWVNKQPMLCVKQTSPDFGGDPAVHCRLCEVEQEHLQSREKAVVDAARRVGAFPQWLTFVFPWEVVDARGIRHPTPPDKMYVPHEHWLRRDAFLEVSGSWERSCEKHPPYGFMDPVTGCDWSVRRSANKSMKHSREEPQAIMSDKTADELIAMIDEKMAKCAPGGIPTCIPKPPTEDEEDQMVAKANDSILVSARTAPRSRSSADVDADAPPARYSRARPEETAPPARTSRTVTEPAPARRTEAAEPPPARRTTAAAQPAAAPARASRASVAAEPPKSSVEDELNSAEPPPGAEREPEPETEPASADEAPPPVRAAGSSPRRNLPPPPARRTTAAPAGKIEDDPETLPEEKRDPAPATSRAAARAPAAAQRELSSAMSQRVSRITAQAL